MINKRCKGIILIIIIISLAMIIAGCSFSENYTVTFISNGGTMVESKSGIARNSTIAEPSSPTKEGSKFLGWYKDDAFTQKFNFETDTIDNDITLYAHWEINKYTVNFETNGGSDVASQTIEYNNNVVIPTVPTLEGYAFIAWYKDSEYKNVFDFNTDTIKQDITLYAYWQKNSYTVAFDTNDGGTVASQVVKYGDKVAVPNTHIKLGHTFIGWYKDSDFDTIFDFDNDTINANITLYAKWEIITYTVTFETNKGSLVPSETVDYGQKLNKPTDPEREDSAFMGWYKDSNFVTLFDFQNDTITSNITLYARWDTMKWIISFDTKGGEPIENIKVLNNTKAEKPQDPKYQGYEFIGWYLDDACTILFDFESKITSDIKLYAKWIVSFEFELASNNQEYYIKGLSQGVSIDKIEIPSVYKDLPVTKILDGAFANNKLLTSVILPNSITHIGDNAFRDCENLNNIVLPSNLHSIGTYAFNNCKTFSIITIPLSVEIINESAFSDSPNLILYIESQEKKVGWVDTCFSGGIILIWDCENNDKDIKDNVYIHLDGIRYILNEGYIAVSKALDNKDRLTIPKVINYKDINYRVTSIAVSAFADCTNLISIVLPEGLERIEPNAFSGCVNLTSINIPETVEDINDEVFMNCTSLSEIWISKNVKNMGESVFANCTNLTINVEHDDEPFEWLFSEWNPNNCTVNWGVAKPN